MKKLMLILLACVFGIFLTGNAMALPVLDFNMDAAHPGSASISYAGGANPLEGSNIGVDSVLGIGTPSNNLVTTAITDGILNFSTGNFSSAGAGGEWNFSGGGSILVTGNIGLGDVDLLTGSFISARVEKESDGGFKVTIASFVDFKDADLLAIYGLPADVPYLGSLNLSFIVNPDVNAPSAFESAVVLSGDIINQPVPEPATMLLLGSGLIGLAGIGRRKFFKK